MHHQNTYKRRDRAGIPVIRFISHKPSIPSMAANRIAIFQNPEPRLKRLSEKKKKKAIDPNTSLLTLLQGRDHKIQMTSIHGVIREQRRSEERERERSGCNRTLFDHSTSSNRH
ncbi:hypothetical protein TNCV_4407751 [Trichonephila clavipes]|nr:hypothetical protein TNCV_4407751 [Trichonephila clavipes]